MPIFYVVDWTITAPPIVVSFEKRGYCKEIRLISDHSGNIID